MRITNQDSILLGASGGDKASERGHFARADCFPRGAREARVRQTTTMTTLAPVAPRRERQEREVERLLRGLRRQH